MQPKEFQCPCCGYKYLNESEQKSCETKDKDSFFEFILKIRERLILITDNNLRNHIPLADIDEQVLLEMYIWYMRTDLFQVDLDKDIENAVQTKLTDNVAYFEKWYGM